MSKKALSLFQDEGEDNNVQEEGQDPGVLQAEVPQELLPAAGGGDERRDD